MAQKAIRQYVDDAPVVSPQKAAIVNAVAPNLEILDMPRRVRRDVLQKTNGEQIRWDNESLVGNVLLADVGTREVAK
jgi:uncharacterized caspase-like protein